MREATGNKVDVQPGNEEVLNTQDAGNNERELG